MKKLATCGAFWGTQIQPTTGLCYQCTVYAGCLFILHRQQSVPLCKVVGSRVCAKVLISSIGHLHLRCQHPSLTESGQATCKHHIILYNLSKTKFDCCLSCLIRLFFFFFAIWLHHFIAGFITETGKSPVVGLFFLNMWGDYQVVPYSPGRTLSFGSKGRLEYAIRGERNLRAQQQKPQSLSSSSPQHYAIVVDETQIKVSLNSQM